VLPHYLGKSKCSTTSLCSKVNSSIQTFNFRKCPRKMLIRCLFKSLIFSMRSTSDVIKTFFQDQDQDQDFKILSRPSLVFKTKTKTSWSKTKTKTKTFIFCPGGASRPRPWSLGLHHCVQHVRYTRFQLCTPATDQWMRRLCPVHTAVPNI